MSSLLITGSNGFIGRKLVEKLDPARYERVYCLSRYANGTVGRLHQVKNFKSIRASILDPKSYASYLPSIDTVVHLAAVTGKRPRKEYFAVNTDGTKILLEQCKQAGVRRFLHISSIAVKYPDKSSYHYALSKELAECAVKESGLAYTIVRPTIVIGTDSPSWKSLLRLAKLPITPIFGNGRNIIQPIYIDDLVECLLSILNEDPFTDKTLELGGPEQISFEKFLTTIHRLYQGRKPRTIHVPLALILSCLSVLEKPLYSILPVTRGQLSAFNNDSTIDVNHIFKRHSSKMKGIDEMLRLVLER